MGRRKSYDRNEVAKKAMMLFWKHGYQGTTSKMLTEEMGINPFSLFSEFGDKKGLFDVTLQLYLDNVKEIFAPLSHANATLDDIRTLFRFYKKFICGPFAERGCLLANVANDGGPRSAFAQSAVDAYLDTISGGFENSLGLAKERSEIRSDVVIVEEARFFTSLVLGLFVLMRAKANPSFLTTALAAAQRHLESLTQNDL